MLRYFPATNTNQPHHQRDYFIIGFTFFSTTLCLAADGLIGLLVVQYFFAVCAWFFLALLLYGETPQIRAQVLVAVAFATIGENFASLYMQGYIYQLGNLPAYVPPGHGMVYLSAVAMARSGFFQNNARTIASIVVVVCGSWALWGISRYAPQEDGIGAILFCVFLVYLFKGRSPLVYLGAFFITSWLELVGTSANTWAWVAIDPASGLTQGNPPSGVAAWYCLVDMVAMGGAPIALAAFLHIKNHLPFKKRVKNAYQSEY